MQSLMLTPKLEQWYGLLEQLYIPVAEQDLGELTRLTGQLLEDWDSTIYYHGSTPAWKQLWEQLDPVFMYLAAYVEKVESDVGHYRTVKTGIRICQKSLIHAYYQHPVVNELLMRDMSEQDLLPERLV